MTIGTFQRNRAGVKMQDIRESECMKTESLSAVCHKSHTPLAAINGFVTMLLRLYVRWNEQGIVT